MKIVKNADEKTKIYDREFVFDSIDDAKLAIEKEEKRKKIWLYSLGISIALSIISGIVVKVNDGNIVLSILYYFYGFSLYSSIFSSGLYFFRWIGRSAKIAYSHFLFITTKILAAFVVGCLFYIILNIFFIPLLMSRHQSKLIIKAAEEYISFHENFNTEEK